MATIEDIRAWVDATRPDDWYGKCAGLTDRVVSAFTGGDRQWYDSATDARLASGPLNPDATACPAGGIHYWAYYGTAWDGSKGNWGHVVIDIRGGGTDCLSATGYAHEAWGVNAGLISVREQSARPGMTYLGWAPTYGAAHRLEIENEAPAGGSAKPFTSTTTGDADMRAVKLAGVPNSGIIIQAATPPSSMGDQVFDALCGAYGLTAQELADWQYGTVVREQWNAFSSANPKSAAQPVDINLSDDDAEAIAKKVREGLTLTVTVKP